MAEDPVNDVQLLNKKYPISTTIYNSTLEAGNGIKLLETGIFSDFSWVKKTTQITKTDYFRLVNQNYCI